MESPTVKFYSEEDAKQFIQDQLTKWCAAKNGAFQFHVKTNPRSEGIPAAQLHIGNLWWKIYSKDEGNDPFTYWTLAISQDLQQFTFTHSNTDASAFSFHHILTTASTVEAAWIHASGPFSLENCIDYIVSNDPPNRYGLS